MLTLWLSLGIPMTSYSQIPSHQNPSEISNRYMTGVIRFNTTGKSYTDFGLDFRIRRRTENSRWRISHNIGGISSVGRDGDDGAFSMQGPINLGLYLLTTRVIYKGEDKYDIYRKPLILALTFPTSKYDFAMTKSMFIGLSNNTEFVFFRGNGGIRGISYTPYLSYSIWGYPNSESWDSVSLHLQLGHTLFWNFEGASRSDGWIAGVSLIMGFTDGKITYPTK